MIPHTAPYFPVRHKQHGERDRSVCMCSLLNAQDWTAVAAGWNWKKCRDWKNKSLPAGRIAEAAVEAAEIQGEMGVDKAHGPNVYVLRRPTL